jgi:Mlc titration factor MtfA (ptsG expression regulator)
VLTVVAVIAAGFAVLGWLLLTPWYRARRRRLATAAGLSAQWRLALENNAPLRARLPPPLRARFDALVTTFATEKQYVGCNGLSVTEEMKVTIAAHACSLLLGRPNELYDGLRSILVYPTPFWVDEEVQDEDGLVTRRRHVLSGQSWDSSRIVVSWEDVVETIENPDSGYNVIVHECAHYFDAEGAAPIVPHGDAAGQVDGGLPGSWREALDAEYERLADEVDDGLDTFLDPYAAEDPAEFFAVACEEFIERPAELELAEPRVYALLRAFYGIDPAAWTQEVSKATPEA